MNKIIGGNIMKGILGRKVEMTQVFTESGILVPVTVIAVESNKVLQVKTVETDGYNALKLGTFNKRENLVNKPEMGNFKKAKSEPKRFVKEIRDMDGYEIGADITAADVFTAGEFIDVTGISKGKGFAGSIKRHNYSRGPMGHGSGYHRGIGSMGAIINRIFKSKKMPGHMGHEQVTIQNLEIISIDNEKNLVLVKGSIPGPRKGYVVLKQNVKGEKANPAVTLLNRSQKAAPAATEPVAEKPAE
jgi:large subunit ribosomal protein L3